MKNRKKVKRAGGVILINLIFPIICFVTLIPIFYAVTLSLEGAGGALSSGLSFIPQEPTLENYRAILVEEPFLLWLKNSAILSVGTMIAAMGTAVTAAYAFSRYRFRARKSILRLLLILNAFPQILSMFAIFRLFRTFHLLNSYLGLIIVYAGSMCIFCIWNMKGYFDTIPVEIEEAAQIDPTPSHLRPEYSKGSAPDRLPSKSRPQKAAIPVCAACAQTGIEELLRFYCLSAFGSPRFSQTMLRPSLNAQICPSTSI